MQYVLFFRALAWFTDFIIRSANATDHQTSQWVRAGVSKIHLRVSHKIRMDSEIHRSLLTTSGMHPLGLKGTRNHNFEVQ